MKTKIFLLLLSVIMIFLVDGCKKDMETSPVDTSREIDLKEAAASLKIAVVSDIHYMAPSLLVADGPAFQAYLQKDPLLLKQSAQIFLRFIDQINAERPNILIISGDLTKDSEVISHQQVVNYLRMRLNPNIKVIAMPGNHDIFDPQAVSFNGSSTSQVPKMTFWDFLGLYQDYGYGQALSRDPMSASYVIEPFKGLRIFMIDASKPNTATQLVNSGVIGLQTMRWLKGQLAIAAQLHVQVLGVMHHQLVPHYTGEVTTDPGYVVDAWQSTAQQLMDAGMSIILTGHYHANDITQYGKLLDISTGSLLTYPLPYRNLTFENRKLYITTHYVRGINVGAEPIEIYGQKFLKQYLTAKLYNFLTTPVGNPPLMISPAAAVPLSQIAAQALMAHYAGDELMPHDQMVLLGSNLLLIPEYWKRKKIYDIVMNWYTDLPVRDNTYRIDLP